MNFFVTADQIKDNNIYIKDSDVNHIKNVLRKETGDLISIVCNGINYSTKILELTSEYVKCEILNQTIAKEYDLKLTIFQGLAKADKIEYIIQKCTELGAFEVIPVEMKRSIVKIDNKDKQKKIERWKKIAEVASKQSLRSEILKVDKILSFKEMLECLNDFDTVIVAYEKEKESSLKSVIKNDCINSKNIAVIIGPEGGIDEDEFKQLTKIGAKSVSLGTRILRTETAPVAICAIIMYELEWEN